VSVLASACTTRVQSINRCLPSFIFHGHTQELRLRPLLSSINICWKICGFWYPVHVWQAAFTHCCQSLHMWSREYIQETEIRTFPTGTLYLTMSMTFFASLSFVLNRKFTSSSQLLVLYGCLVSKSASELWKKGILSNFCYIALYCYTASRGLHSIKQGYA